MGWQELTNLVYVNDGPAIDSEEHQSLLYTKEQEKRIRLIRALLRVVPMLSSLQGTEQEKFIVQSTLESCMEYLSERPLVYDKCVPPVWKEPGKIIMGSLGHYEDWCFNRKLEPISAANIHAFEEYCNKLRSTHEDKDYQSCSEY